MHTLQELAHKYNHIDYFKSDPVIFPRHFKELWQKGEASLMDIEISGILCAHLAWGRREMIVRDCRILMDEMEWRPAGHQVRIVPAELDDWAGAYGAAWQAMQENVG